MCFIIGPYCGFLLYVLFNVVLFKKIFYKIYLKKYLKNIFYEPYCRLFKFIILIKND